MIINMIIAVYKHELEPERTEVLKFKTIEDLKKHIQLETCEYEGDPEINPEDRKVLNEGNVYYDEGFGTYHSWEVVGEEMVTKVYSVVVSRDLIKSGVQILPQYQQFETIYSIYKNKSDADTMASRLNAINDQEAVHCFVREEELKGAKYEKN